MRLFKFLQTTVLLGSLSVLGACGTEDRSLPNEGSDNPASNETPALDAGGFPQSLRVMGDGYPRSGDPCRRLGESEATADWLDDSADLAGCPTREAAEALKGKIVGEVNGITIVSVPTGDANAGLSVSTSASSGDFIRGKGGLEEKCKARVARETGARVTGTNRIEESEAAIAIFVNVEGGEAPWRCLGYKDGTIGDVMYTGDEGAA